MDPAGGWRAGPTERMRRAGVGFSPSSPQFSPRRIQTDFHPEKELNRGDSCEAPAGNSISLGIICSLRKLFSRATAGSGFLSSPPALLPLLLISSGDTMPTKSSVSSLRNWIQVKRISQPWFSSHSSSSRLHRRLI